MITTTRPGPTDERATTTSRERHAITARAGQVALVSRATQPCPVGHARVAIVVAGICRTDLYAAAGALGVPDGRVLGHEAWGVVTDSAGKAPAVGTRVAIDPRYPCGRCDHCGTGRPCATPELLGVQHDGVFATTAVLPAQQLIPIPDALDERHAAFVEPAAAALAVANASLPLDTPGVLIGRGRIATLVKRVLVSLGARDVTVIAADAAPRSLRRAYRWCVETEATTASLRLAFHAALPDAIVVWKSRPVTSPAVDIALAVKKRLTIKAVDYCDFPRAIAWLLEHPQHDIFAAATPWHDYEAAFERAARDESHKVFLRFS